MARTLEVLDARGLADDLLALGATTPGVDLWAGARLRLDRLPTRFPYALITPQVNVDRAAGRVRIAQGATIRRGVEVTGLRPDADGVDVLVAGGRAAAGALRRRRRRCAQPGPVVGGAAVPRQGRAVVGRAGRRRAHGRADRTGPGCRPRRRTRWRSSPRTAGGASTARCYRSMTWDRRRQLPTRCRSTRPRSRASSPGRSGATSAWPRSGWHSRFHCEERLVPSYRAGRVLLAGDAAHVHSPGRRRRA